MTDETYNGLTNWDTWNANLWLTNDQLSYNAISSVPDVEDIEDFFLTKFRDISTDTGWIDGINPLRVNWQEIYDSLHEHEEKN